MQKLFWLFVTVYNEVEDKKLENCNLLQIFGGILRDNT